MADLDVLMTAKSQVVQRIADVTASIQPDYSENGRTVSKASLLSILFQQLENLDNAIARASGPFEVRSVNRGGGCCSWP